jgi:hypothetical protein
VDEEARFARVEVTVTSAGGTVRTFAADWPAKASVEMKSGLLPSLSGQPWPSVTGVSPNGRLLVDVEADGRRPILATIAGGRPPRFERMPTLADDPLVAFAAARLAEDEERVRATGDAHRVAWLTLKDEAGQMLYTTVAAEWGDDGWVAMGEEVPRPYSVLAIYDTARARRELAAARAVIGSQESDHAPVETMYGLCCRTCVNWQDDEGAHEFGIAIPVAWPCRVARAAVAAWADHPEFRKDEWAL